ALERNTGLLIFGILVVSSIGGLVQVLPTIVDDSLATPAANVVPHTPLELVGRDVYIRESCSTCHSQQVRPLLAEVKRYGQYAGSGEFAYERPFLWGSKRTGPDLLRVGGKYTDAWHRVHMANPRAVVPSSIMPSYPWLAEHPADDGTVIARLEALRTLGHPYSDADIEGAPAALAGKTELDGVVAYLQSLGKFAPPEPAADGHGGH
ncbi:MAG TPA: cytochrome-c oxidase, cbb3-type subunit II, partial [Rhodanobacteraceae bacterium]|nr:cytochrome-c oxidase, cbb3-type subunit II [Rhodanobacteraceae bacterium]